MGNAISRDAVPSTLVGALLRAGLKMETGGLALLLAWQQRAFGFASMHSVDLDVSPLFAAYIGAACLGIFCLISYKFDISAFSRTWMIALVSVSACAGMLATVFLGFDALTGWADYLAGAVVGYFTNLFPNDPPKFIIMEAQAADCLYRGALAGDGSPRIVDGDLQTIMAGLACGEPNTISWDILRNHATAFVSCPDWVSARGMRMLGVPVKGDPVVISGESGAVGMGLIAAIMETDEYKELREAIGLDRFSQVLMFSTEGNTDPMKFRKVLWDGEYPTV